MSNWRTCRRVRYRASPCASRVRCRSTPTRVFALASRLSRRGREKRPDPPSGTNGARRVPLPDGDARSTFRTRSRPRPYTIHTIRYRYRLGGLRSVHSPFRSKDASRQPTGGTHHHGSGVWETPSRGGAILGSLCGSGAQKACLCSSKKKIDFFYFLRPAGVILSARWPDADSLRAR